MMLARCDGAFAGLILAIRPEEWRDTGARAGASRRRSRPPSEGRYLDAEDVAWVSAEDVAWAYGRGLPGELRGERPTLTEALRACGLEHTPSHGAWAHDITAGGVAVATLTAAEAWGWLDALDAARASARPP